MESMNASDAPNVSKWHSIVIIIDDIRKLHSEASDDTVERLKNIVVLGKKLKVYVFAKGEKNELAGLYHGGDSFTMALVDSATRIIMGGTAGSHNAIKTGLGSSEISADLAEDEGYILTDGKAEKLKCVT